MKNIVIGIIIILTMFFLFLFWGGSFFTKLSIDETVEELREQIDFSQNEYFVHSQLEDQPNLIKDYFQAVISDSVIIPKFITLQQTAQFKTDVNADWMPITATQYFTTEKTNFLWYSEMKTSKFFWVNAIDSYINGKGNMLIKFNSSVTVADSWGLELDKSGIFRYISEAVLFPTSLVPSNNLKWDVLDSNTAEIKFSENEISVVAKLFFDSSNRIYKIETFDKYRALDIGYEKSLYTIYLSEYKNFNNSFTVPTYIEVEWDLKNGKFKYGKFTIDSILYE